MPTNGSNKRPTEYIPVSPAVNNWVYIKHTDGSFGTHIMTIFDYRNLRRKIMTGFFDDIYKATGLIKPKDETKYLEINPNDSALKAYLKQRENEANNN